MARKLSSYMKKYEFFERKKKKALEKEERQNQKQVITMERQRYEWRKGL